jgi:hypothetical protein
MLFHLVGLKKNIELYNEVIELEDNCGKELPGCRRFPGKSRACSISLAAEPALASTGSDVN